MIDKKIENIIQKRDVRIEKFVDDVFKDFQITYRNIFGFDSCHNHEGLKNLIRIFSRLRDKNRPILDHVERMEEFSLVNHKRSLEKQRNRTYDIKIYKHLNKSNIIRFLFRVFNSYDSLKKQKFENLSKNLLKADINQISTQCRKISSYLSKKNNLQLTQKIDFELNGIYSAEGETGLNLDKKFLLDFLNQMKTLVPVLGSNKKFTYHRELFKALDFDGLSMVDLILNDAVVQLYKDFTLLEIKEGGFVNNFQRIVDRLAAGSSDYKKIRQKSALAYQAQSGLFAALFLKNTSEDVKFDVTFVQSVLYDLNFVFEGAFLELVKTHKGERETKVYDQRALVRAVFNVCGHEYDGGVDKFDSLVKKSSETVADRLIKKKIKILSMSELREIALKFWPKQN